MGRPLVNQNNTESNAPAPHASRRTIVKAGAWSIPVVATAYAAPTAAASTTCADAEANVPLIWATSGIPSQNAGTTNATLTRTGAFTSSAVGSLGAVGVEVVHTFFGAEKSVDPNAMPYEDEYIVAQRVYGPLNSNGPGTYQDVKFTFSEPLYNLRFSIWEITREWGNSSRSYVDNVVLTSPTAYSESKPTGSFVVGDGSSASPWKRPIDGPLPWNLVDGQVDIVFSGAVQTFTIRYRNSGYLEPIPTQTTPDGHHIRITNMMADRICPA